MKRKIRHFRSTVQSKKKLDNNFILSNGDTLFDINLSDLVKQFRKKECSMFYFFKKNKKK